jgi:hypothetical protein
MSLLLLIHDTKRSKKTNKKLMIYFSWFNPLIVLKHMVFGDEKKHNTSDHIIFI